MKSMRYLINHVLFYTVLYLGNAGQELRYEHSRNWLERLSFNVNQVFCRFPILDEEWNNLKCFSGGCWGIWSLES